MKCMKYLSALFILLAFAIYDVNAVMCATPDGLFWCEANKSTCYYYGGSVYHPPYCQAIRYSDGVVTFNRANCRKCANKSCGLVTSDFTGKLLVYKYTNNYFLTTKGWCYIE